MRPLLVELHAHTTWSDGTLPLDAVVDLYGSHGFDVLCVTDHTVRDENATPSSVGMHNWRNYLDAVDEEAERARSEWGMLLVPGLELTDQHDDELRSAHAVAIGLRSFVSIEPGMNAAVRASRRAGAAIVAVHPHAPGDNRRGTCRWWAERDAPVVRPDRYELFNQSDVFTWVAGQGVPVVAAGDFHRLEHLNTWKTLLPCARDEQSVVSFLRSDARAYLAPFPLGVRPAAATVAA